MKIKDWAEDDRPREKLLSKGISSLSDAELLAIIIGSEIPPKQPLNYPNAFFSRRRIILIY